MEQNTSIQLGKTTRHQKTKTPQNHYSHPRLLFSTLLELTPKIIHLKLLVILIFQL